MYHYCVKKHEEPPTDDSASKRGECHLDPNSMNVGSDAPRQERQRRDHRDDRTDDCKSFVSSGLAHVPGKEGGEEREWVRFSGAVSNSTHHPAKRLPADPTMEEGRRMRPGKVMEESKSAY